MLSLSQISQYCKVGGVNLPSLVIRLVIRLVTRLVTDRYSIKGFHLHSVAGSAKVGLNGSHRPNTVLFCYH